MFGTIDWAQPWYASVRAAAALAAQQHADVIPAFNARAAALGLVNHAGRKRWVVRVANGVSSAEGNAGGGVQDGHLHGLALKSQRG